MHKRIQAVFALALALAAASSALAQPSAAASGDAGPYHVAQTFRVGGEGALCHDGDGACGCHGGTGGEFYGDVSIDSESAAACCFSAGACSLSTRINSASEVIPLATNKIPSSWRFRVPA